MRDKTLRWSSTKEPASLLTQRAGCRRNANLQRRVDKKVETKKAKREKKLMRPGFEGRRDTFL